ncbi:hypothetical protein C9374_000490 [Naegleria lovaniensis]|uniref:Guanine nucleotide-binding protein subunit beta-like protein n=1 Tax=Naegleria lovaniensis TaxID=51637 RepID=A0AA88GYH0_NAELO|nr:uncharacterized protein C9374_000490 [Naegleria lovaniensis]KAG2388326.1 hypothetical protein C9374_000490 [Naegleria lovaniensis]
MFSFNMLTSCFNSVFPTRQITNITNITNNKFKSKPIRQSPSTLKNKVQKVQISNIIHSKNTRAKGCCFLRDGRIATAFYKGFATIQELDEGTMKEIIELAPEGYPLRCVKFIERINCLVAGSDSCLIYVYDCQKQLIVKELNSHLDYLRCLEVHPTLPYLISCSDDQTIRVFNWENDWKSEIILTGHSHYVMRICLNPHNPNILASCSLDHTVRIWEIDFPKQYEIFTQEKTTTSSNFVSTLKNIFNLSSPIQTLEGFQYGVDCVDFYRGRDPAKMNWLIACSDDKTLRIFNWKTAECIMTFPDIHTHNISSCIFENDLIISGGEDSIVNIISVDNFKVLHSFSTKSFGRVWSLEIDKYCQSVYCNRSIDEEEPFTLAICCDEGLVLLKVQKTMTVSYKIVLTHALEQLSDIDIITTTSFDDDEEIAAIHHRTEIPASSSSLENNSDEYSYNQ